MYKKLVNVLYVMNIVVQAFFTLAVPIGLGVLVSYLLTTLAGAPSWIYAVLIVAGAFVGLFSMVKFILSSMAALEHLEAEQKAREQAKKSDISKHK